PFTLDVKGNPTIAHSPLALPVAWTDSGNPAADGWNLVSNPLPSPIDFEAIALGADVANGYWLFDPATGNTQCWSNGVGTGAANGILQSSQGFWLKATGPAVTTTVDESAKVLAGAGGAFGGDQEVQLPIMRIHLTGAMNSFADEVVVVFDEGTPAFDPIDAPQFVFAHPQAPQIAARSTDGVSLSIDFYGGYDAAVTIPLLLNAAVSGTYTVTSEMTGDHALSCMSIEDLITGAVVPFGNGSSYTFTLDANADPGTPRLLLHASAPLAMDLVPATCFGTSTGSAAINVGDGPVDFAWTSPDGAQHTMPAVSGIVSLDGLPAGAYAFTVSTGTACGDLQGAFTIDQPFAMEATSSGSGTSCATSADGTVQVDVLGGVAPYTFLWSNGTTGSQLIGAAGAYEVLITDANGCTLTAQALTIEAGQGPIAFITAASNALVNEAVIFSAASEGATAWEWSFGDGAVSVEEVAVHSYAQPGTYTVELTVHDGNCSNTTSHVVLVESNTAVADLASSTVRAWVRDREILVDHPVASANVRVEVYDAGGRLLVDQVSSGSAGRTVVRSVEGTGIYTLRITLDERIHTARVLLAQ
nr:PKD domain-containing protein [Flavobacteriales bacterium]